MTIAVPRAAPFGAFTPTPLESRLLRIAQGAPHNFLGKLLARWARGLYLLRARLPVDLHVGAVRLRCYLRDNTGERKFVFTPWRYDRLELAALAAALPRDGVFVDVGANVGIYTLCAALNLGSQGRVLAIEPHPAVYQRLLFNIEATRQGREQWPRIDTVEVGVAETTATVKLRVDAGNLGGSSILAGKARFSPAGSHEELSIQCLPLMDLLARADIRRIDVLKIDIEGAEDRALMPFLAQAEEPQLPRRILIENSQALWAADLPGALAARGYLPALRTRLNTVYAR